MQITKRTIPDAVVLDVMGRLVAGGPEFDFETAVRQVLQAGHRAVVVNLKAVPCIDAAGIGALIGAACSARESGVPLAFAEPAARVRSLLSLTGVVRAIQVSPTLDAALAAVE